jgi:hypothetical protein
MSKCVFQGAIQHMNANIEETLDSVPVPSHLLLLHHSFGTWSSSRSGPWSAQQKDGKIGTERRNILHTNNGQRLTG